MRRRSVLAGVALVLGALLVVSLAVASGGKKNFNARTLIGYEENPDVSTIALGVVRASRRRKRSDGHVRAHLCRARRGRPAGAHPLRQAAVNGGISLFLCSNLANGPAGTPDVPAVRHGLSNGSGRRHRRPEPAQGIEAGNLSELVAAMRAGNAYANVHSSKWPGGEIRAQIK